VCGSAKIVGKSSHSCSIFGKSGLPLIWRPCDDELILHVVFVHTHIYIYNTCNKFGASCAYCVRGIKQNVTTSSPKCYISFKTPLSSGTTRVPGIIYTCTMCMHNVCVCVCVYVCVREETFRPQYTRIYVRIYLPALYVDDDVSLFYRTQKRQTLRQPFIRRRRWFSRQRNFRWLTAGVVDPHRLCLSLYIYIYRY